MRELLRRGEIPTVHIGDRTLIYDADLHEFIARHRIVRVVARSYWSWRLRLLRLAGWFNSLRLQLLWQSRTDNPMGRASRVRPQRPAMCFVRAAEE